MDTTTRRFASGSNSCIALVAWRDETLAAGNALRSLELLLQLSGVFKASNPRDKIYALLGICDGISDEGIVIDYECSVQYAYTEVARQLLSRAKDFVVLSTAGIGFARTYNDLPSWVPDWTSIAHNGFLNSSIWANYHATPKGPPHIKAMSDPSILAIGGIYIDQITAVHELSPVHDVRHNYQGARFLDHKFNKSSRQFSLDTNPSLPLCEREEAHWRTLCANQDNTGHLLSAEYAQYYDCYVTARERSVETRANGTQEDKEQMKIISKGAMMYTKAWFGIGKRRRLCRTALGFLGLAPPNTKVGDSVCLLLGAIAPFILREHDPTPDGDQTYILVGECYVHGLMNLEGMKMGDVREFILR